MNNYIVVSNDFLDELENAVNVLIEQGYEPCGSLAHSKLWVQPMIKAVRPYVHGFYAMGVGETQP